MTEDRIVLPNQDDVETAAQRIQTLAVRTPLLEAPLLNRYLGGRLLVKAEVVQRTGSFKFRGAYNKISRTNRSREIDGRGGVLIGEPRPRRGTRGAPARCSGHHRHAGQRPPPSSSGTRGLTAPRW